MTVDGVGYDLVLFGVVLGEGSYFPVQSAQSSLDRKPVLTLELFIPCWWPASLQWLNSGVHGSFSAVHLSHLPLGRFAGSISGVEAFIGAAHTSHSPCFLKDKWRHVKWSNCRSLRSSFPGFPGLSWLPISSYCMLVWLADSLVVIVVWLSDSLVVLWQRAVWICRCMSRHLPVGQC